ncbi:MAG TPA: cell surface protein SprA [Gemmatimonadales bacterium]|nr:cell surface protein SprA [Gemmatimonadales bacterium]
MARHALALCLLLLAPAVLAAQADSTAPGVRFRLPGELPTLRPSAYHLLARAALRPDAAGVATAWRQEVERSLEGAREARAEATLLRALYGQQGDGGPQGNGLLALGRRYTDLSLDGSAGLELRTDRLKNHRCTPYQLQDPASGCQGHFTAPRLDSEFLIRAGGVVGRRLNIAVDYDSKRDFEANNDIRVFYQGLEDEIVQRVEFGTVTFTPPPSRFITAAVPAYSFGINTKFEFGPVTLGALAASQKGSAVTERTYTVGATTSQPQDRALRDLDFEQGRFFWVVDPGAIAGFPAVDILNLSAGAVPLAERPTAVRVYRYRPPQTSGGNPVLGGIRATAFRPHSPQSLGKVQWELLVDGQDYALDASGLWVALANRLDAGDFLAVSYVTAADDTVGTFPSVDDPAANDSLLLIVTPKQAPTDSTFRHEMRQVYRVSGTDLDRPSLHVDLTLNRSESPAQGAATYLAQLGLAIPTDPDVMDVGNRLYPRSRDLLASKVLREAFIIFPDLEPFADPAKLTPAERTDSLYRTPLYLLFNEGPPSRFQFHLKYNAAGSSDRDRIELNAFQIRQGSERVSVDGRTLERGVDYNISYELGQVTFLNPDDLFGNSAANVNVRFEERGIFAVAPTTIYGLTSTYRVGEAGAFNFIGIYQQENTVFNRPPVGFEPTANLVGGFTGDFRFKPKWATSLMNSLVSGGTEAPSSFDLSGEFAFTSPQLNRAGEAYLEEFEGEAGIQVNLRENGWGFGSRPRSPDGLEGIGFAAGFDSSDAVQITWQNLVSNQGRPVEVRTQDIDSLVRLTGGANPVETVLYLTMHADTAGGFVRRNNSSAWSLPRRDNRPRWRSMVTSLSATGTDLSQSEYLEFWLFEGASASADSAGINLVLDLGSVGEDALAIAPESLTVTGTDSVWTGRRYAGVGRLDTERNQSGYFNAQEDDNGILVDRPDSLVADGVPVQDVPTCGQELSGVVPLYRWGDLGVRCTRGNGTMDTEDLNGDNVLDANGSADNVRRYIVKLGDPKYFVRNGGTGWRLYRIPLRLPDAVIGAPNIRLVQHLRITLATPPDAGLPDLVGRFALARFRFLGSPWVRRSDAPVLGLSGATAQPHGEVVVTTISTDNRELGYEPPPGVLNQAGRNDAGRGLQINERSLRIIGRDLQPGERAEGYFRFIAGAQNLLKYRTLKLWVRGRGPGWNDGRLQAVFKVASDDRNFYAYRTNAFDDTWDPEVVVELETWRRLRAEIENRWLQGEAPSGSVACGLGDSTAYVACQGGYVVQVADPGINPPNLAAVQEIDAAVYYAGTGASLPEAELWVDDVRLVDPVNTVGTATALSARLAAADVADLSFGYVRQDGNFQQIGQDPTYRTTATAVVATTVRMDRFLPKSLGLSIPTSVSYTRSATDPLLVSGTDLRASDLPGLRKPSASQWSWGVSVRRTQRGRTWLTRGLVDPLGLNGSLTTGASTTELSTADNSTYTLGANYNLVLARRGPKLPLDGVVRGLPRWLRQSPVGEGLTGSTLSLVPTSVRFNSGLSRSEATFTSYRVAVERPDDSLRTPTLNLSHVWRNSAGVTFQPLGMLTIDGNLTSTRDLRRYADSTPLGRLAGEGRRQFLGMDVGVERDRQLSTSVSLTPVVSRWLRPRYLRSSGFGLFRDLTSRDPVRVDGDSGAFLLPQTYNNQQSNELGFSVDVNRVAGLVAGDSSRVGRYFRGLRPLDLSLRTSRAASFDLATFEPDLGFMLALGGLDEFRSHNGTRAVGASQTDEARVGTGADLPGGFSMTLSYADVLSRTYSQVGTGTSVNEGRQREWPQGTARWNRPLRRGPVALFGLGASLRKREGSTITSSEAGAARAKNTQSVLNPDAVLSLRNGITVNVAYSHTATINETGTNRTEQATDQWTGTLAHTLRLPASISVSRRPLRASVNGQTSTSTSCLFLGSSPELGCRTVADVRRLSMSGGFTTDVLPMATAGLNFQYVSNDIRHLNQKTTQLSIVASLRVQLSAGDLR